MGKKKIAGPVAGGMEEGAPLSEMEQVHTLAMERDAHETRLAEARGCLRKSESLAHTLVSQGQFLESEVGEARETMADLYFFLQQKLDNNYNVIVGLERKIVLQRVEVEIEEKRARKRRQKIGDEHETRMKTLRERLETSADNLRRVQANNVKQQDIDLETNSVTDTLTILTDTPAPCDVVAEEEQAVEVDDDGEPRPSVEALIGRYAYAIGDFEERTSAVATRVALEVGCERAEAHLANRVKTARRDRVRHKEKLKRELAERAQGAEVDSSRNWGAKKETLMNLIDEAHQSSSDALHFSARKASGLVAENKRLTKIHDRLKRDLEISRETQSSTLHRNELIPTGRRTRRSKPNNSSQQDGNYFQAPASSPITPKRRTAPLSRLDREIEDRSQELVKLETKVAGVGSELDAALLILHRSLGDAKRDAAEADIPRGSRVAKASMLVSPNDPWPSSLREIMDVRDVPPLINNLAAAAHKLRLELKHALGQADPIFITSGLHSR